MENHSVVPDVVDSLPEVVLRVSYPNCQNVGCGNVLTPTQVKAPPKVSWDARPGEWFTLCFTDPDAPSRSDPKFREWHHWLVVNIPENSVNKGNVLSEYVGAGPPKNSGLHRYVFLLYKQTGKIQFAERRLSKGSGQGRGNFNTRKFAQKYGLGEPVAWNMFQAEYDDYVPTLYKQLRG